MSSVAPDQGLYFIAIIPGEPVLNDAQKWKEHFATEYNSKASLNSPPHITLHMPFKCKLKKEQSLIESLTIVARLSSFFDLKVEGFDAFPPRVIFLKVLKTESLKLLNENIHQVMKTQFNIFNADYRNHPFIPHITLAFRDLKKDKFEEAWREFGSKPYQQELHVDQYWLLKHDGKKWQSYQKFSL